MMTLLLALVMACGPANDTGTPEAPPGAQRLECPDAQPIRVDLALEEGLPVIVECQGGQCWSGNWYSELGSIPLPCSPGRVWYISRL